MPSNPQCYSTYIRKPSDPNYDGWCYMRQWGSGEAASDYAKRLQRENPTWDVMASKNTGEVVYEQDGILSTRPTESHKMSANAYLDARIARANRLCKSSTIPNAIEAMDALSQHLSALATEMSNIQYADQDRKGNEYLNAADFEERLELMVEDIRALTSKIDDANIRDMASDLPKPHDP